MFYSASRALFISTNTLVTVLAGRYVFTSARRHAIKQYHSGEYEKRCSVGIDGVQSGKMHGRFGGICSFFTAKSLKAI
jgi:hypothetical protein